MIAFVLSGGNNFGAMQAGALLALAEAGITPDIVVGTSAGAINGAMVAYDSSAAHMAKLVDIWRNLSVAKVFPGNYASALWRLARSETGLYSNEPFKQFLRESLPADARTFADLHAARLYTIATEIPTGVRYIFGQNPDDAVLDALLASAAIPPLHPTYHIDEHAFVDGALSSQFPLNIAIELGAKTIYALHVYHNPACTDTGNVFAVTQWAFAKLLNDRDALELRQARQMLGKRLHYIQLASDLDIPSTDFSNSETLIAQGHLITQAYLQGMTTPLGAQLSEYWNIFVGQCAQIGKRLADLKAQLIPHASPETPKK